MPNGNWVSSDAQLTHPVKDGSSDVGQLWSQQQQFVDLREHSTAADAIEDDWSQLSFRSKGTNEALSVPAVKVSFVKEALFEDCLWIR